MIRIRIGILFSRFSVPDGFDILPGFVPLNPTGINWPISNNDVNDNNGDNNT